MKVSSISFILVIVLILLVGVSTALRVTNDHKDKLLRVASSKIEDAAQKCYLEEKCTTTNTTLGFLIESGYLEEQVHPITKEFIDKSLVVECINYRCKTELK